MLDRGRAATWYRQNRERSRALFDLVVDDAYYARPIALRHPVVFYEGHLPAFSFNTLVKKALGGASIDARLEALFARGIDPDEASAHGAASDHAGWPARDEVRAFAAEADRRVLEALADADLEKPGDPWLDRAEAVFTILEHEPMHHETLCYMWHRLPYEAKRRPPGYAPRTSGSVPESDSVEVPGGMAVLGVNRTQVAFGWDNEFPACGAEVAPFRIERHDVTNARFMEFVDAGGYADRRWWDADDWAWVQRDGGKHPAFWEHTDGAWWWRGMFERVPLPPAWPVYVSHAEAAAYARWRGARLPSEAEFQCAAFGTVGDLRQHPWGEAPPSPAHGVFDFSSWDPEPAGSHPMGRSACGVEDLVGNGWEWTSTPFGPFPGFRATASYPEYSSDFFDGEHLVLKGASPATATTFLRPTFRNWFRPRYPYVYATFRCATSLGHRRR
jgi:ergothioneine biosynthesis protein EgtB